MPWRPTKRIKRKRGAAVEEEEIFLQRLMPADALRIRGQHNALNALAALALASAAGCPLGPMLYGLREYHGEPHRVESVAIVDQVEYFDDSKGTNVGATVAALHGLGDERRIVVILGGDGKGQDFEPLAAPVRQVRARGGADRPRRAADRGRAGLDRRHAACTPRSMDEAVQLRRGARAPRRRRAAVAGLRQLRHVQGLRAPRRRCSARPCRRWPTPARRRVHEEDAS